MQPRDRPAVALFLAACVPLIVGWWIFDFVCDDAFIAFRYAENLLEGHGLVWNRPPFHPVEGYTSLLWVCVCAAIWGLTGIEPPAFVNVLLLVSSIGSLAVVTHLVWRMPLGERMEPWRPVWLALVLLGTTTNRTFLVWTSSGLEQGFFTLLLLAFVATATLGSVDRRRLLRLGLIAALMSLTRPDGLLFMAFVVSFCAMWLLRHRRPADLVLLGPVLVPVAHVGWRLWRYGYALPNTYYVKVGEPWPDMGLRYLASFCVEYAYVLVLPLLCLWGVALVRRPTAPTFESSIRWGAVCAVVLHAAYYVILVGGDHFEFRVFHHLVPLVLVAFVWLASRVAAGPRLAVGWMASMLVVGFVLPWSNWALTRDFTERHEGGLPYQRLARHYPAPLRPWVKLHQSLHNDLIRHSVGVRFQSHKIFIEQVQPSRTPERGSYELPPGDIHVYTTGTVGLPGWAMPDVAILDAYGLNDRVIARTPRAFDERYMAHDRRAPPGYLECFRANVFVDGDGLVVATRRELLTAEQVRVCEQTFLEAATTP